MRRLTLILSDLYLPEEVSGDSVPGAALTLPNFEWLLRFAADPELAGDWRRWLVLELGVPELAEMPASEVAARAWLPTAGSSVWLATPLHLSARLDHVRLDERGLLRIEGPEAGAWSAEFASHFAPRFQLHAVGERGFLLTGMDSTPMSTMDPARLLGMDIGAALPRGSGSADLRRLGSEVEMWLHASPLNDSRERAGKPRVSTLWFWGGGGHAVRPLTRVPAPLAALRFHGGDPFLAGLAVILGSNMPAPAPVRFAQLDAAADHHVVELAPMTGHPAEALASLETNWFAAARQVLGTGALSSLEIIANDRCFRIAPHASWRFWRRRRSWLENLARRSGDPKA